MSYVNCVQFYEGSFHSVDAIFQLFSYVPCKLNVLMLVVIFKKGISRGILDIGAGCRLERKSLPELLQFL